MGSRVESCRWITNDVTPKQTVETDEPALGLMPALGTGTEIGFVCHGGECISPALGPPAVALLFLIQRLHRPLEDAKLHLPDLLLGLARFAAGVTVVTV